MSDFKGKVALITGASGKNGLGQTVALLFAKNGAKVALASRDVAGLEETKQICAAYVKDLNTDILIVPTDVTKPLDCKNAISKTVKHFKKLDILVNSSGYLVLDTLQTCDSAKALGQEGVNSEELFQGYSKIMDVNVKGPLMMCHYAAPHLIESKGAIVNVSSLTSFRACPGELFSYQISKGAVDHLTRLVALDLASSGVRVNSVNPTYFPTTLYSRAGIAPEDEKNRFAGPLVASEPLGRMLKVEEVAECVMFLASERASFVSGVSLPIDGGRNSFAKV